PLPGPQEIRGHSAYPGARLAAGAFSRYHACPARLRDWAQGRGHCALARVLRPAACYGRAPHHRIIPGGVDRGFLSRRPHTTSHMQAPLVATRAAARPDATTRGPIHPPLDLAPDEIDIHATANIPRVIVCGTPCEGRAQVVPVRVPAGITRRGVGVPPEKQERVPAHPHPRNPTPNGVLVKGSKRLEALHQSHLLEVGGAARGGRLCDVRVDLACGHEVPIKPKLGLLCRGQPL